MYIQKVISKKTFKKPFFGGILSATDQKSRIRIRKSVDRIRRSGSGFVPKMSLIHKTRQKGGKEEDPIARRKRHTYLKSERANVSNERMLGNNIKMERTKKGVCGFTK
jgi:hypothetical protein